MIVDPTNPNPRAFRSFEMASESSVRGGISDCVFQWLTSGFPPVQPHRYASKLPQLLLHLEEAFRVVDRGSDLGPVANDAGIGEQPRDIPRAEARHARGIESAVGGAVGVPLFQDGEPAQPGLRGLQDEELEVPHIVVDGRPPLGVVVGHVPARWPSLHGQRIRPGLFRSCARPSPCATRNQSMSFRATVIGSGRLGSASAAYQPASSSSDSLHPISPAACSAVKATIREWGNGQGWLAK